MYYSLSSISNVEIHKHALLLGVDIFKVVQYIRNQKIVFIFVIFLLLYLNFNLIDLFNLLFHPLNLTLHRIVLAWLLFHNLIQQLSTFSKIWDFELFKWRLFLFYFCFGILQYVYYKQLMKLFNILIKIIFNDGIIKSLMFLLSIRILITELLLFHSLGD